jgi:hypothetical protein
MGQFIFKDSDNFLIVLIFFLIKKSLMSPKNDSIISLIFTELSPLILLTNFDLISPILNF